MTASVVKSRRMGGSCWSEPLSVVGVSLVGMTKHEDVDGVNELPDARLWGKQHGLKHGRRYPVVCHLLDTAAVCLALWDELLGPRVRECAAEALGLPVEDARKVVAFWAGLHDLGKITPVFQAGLSRAFEEIRGEAGYLCAPGAEEERGFRHEAATHWALAGLLEEAGYPQGRRIAQSLSHRVAQLLGGHHGCFGPVLTRREIEQGSVRQPGLGEAGWAGQRRAHLRALQRVLGAEAVPRGGLPDDLAVVVTGLVVVADWLASQTGAIEKLMPARGWQAGSVELDEHWKRTCDAAVGLVDEAQLGRASFAAEWFSEMFPFTPNPLQADVAERLPSLVDERGSGLVLVTAPTGDGKTEAALYAASILGRAADARGLYFGLPTMATADGMFPRVASFAGRALGGQRALTLLHSMAWLHPTYGEGQAAAARVEDSEQVSAAEDTAVAAGAWLRGAKRGLLAPLGVGTIDQALGAVLPLKHNALRLFGLSEKVLVVDEAHAYGPWMHSLLTRLLEWLGALRAPVVLLSATLTGRAASSLVNAYRRGAGFEPAEVQPAYPGWVFTDAASGCVSSPRAVASARSRRLDVCMRSVMWDSSAPVGSEVGAGGRREALRQELSPVLRDGGTALVCCTTVAEAQCTFRDLRTAFPDLASADGGLRLLHSRYAARERQRITEECEAAYGKPRTTPEWAQERPASILVATQVVEQSLDLDFDLVVSDLAPLAQLLQRAGRARRHARGPEARPSWARREDEPRLVVLEPVGENSRTTVPRSWGAVYSPGLLVRTALLLHRVEQSGISIPGDLQQLVDEVYAEDFVDRVDEAVQQELDRMDTEREAEEMAERHLAQMTHICGPADVKGDLYRLSERQAGVSEELLTTRLGADTGRVLCLYEQPDGELTLDADGGMRFRDLSRQPSRGELAELMCRVAPVPGSWLRGVEGMSVPGEWRKQPLLRDLVLLQVNPVGHHSWACQHGDRSISVTPEGFEMS